MGLARRPRSPRDTRGDALALRRRPGRGPGPAPFLVDGDPAKVDAIVASLATGPGGLVPSGAAPEDVAGAIKVVLRSLPEPLLSFSLHAAVVQAGRKARTSRTSPSSPRCYHRRGARR